MFNILADAIEHNLEVDSVHFDFSKAFHSVYRRKLIYKLEKYCISG